LVGSRIEPDPDITSELGLTEPPSWLARLTPAARAELLLAIRALRDRRRDELRQAIDRALEQVPRLLRAALRKVLFS
jgi:hypothetical protein